LNPYNDAVNALHANKLGEAERLFLQMMNEDFDNPVLMFALGMTCVANRKTGVAYSLLRARSSAWTMRDEAYKRLGVFSRTRRASRSAISSSSRKPSA
jgi:hypothetical protein